MTQKILLPLLAFSLILTLGAVPTYDAENDEVNLNGATVRNIGRLRIPQGTDLPSECDVGDLFVDIDADTNGSPFVCISPDTWKEVDDDGGGATAAGADTHVQYNSGGSSFAGEADFTWDDVNNILNIAAGGDFRIGGTTIVDDSPDSDAEVPDGITVDLGAGGNVTGGTASRCARFDSSGDLVAHTGDCAGGSGHTIQEDGSGLTARSNLNFLGVGMTCVDAGAGPDATNCTVNIRVPATVCTAESGAVSGAICLDDTANQIYVCEEADGECDTAGEWILYNPAAAGGDAVSVNDSAATDANFVDNTQIQFSLNGTPDPDEVSATILAVPSSATITLAQSAAPTPTVEGRMEWDTDGNFPCFGDGTGTVCLEPVPKFTECFTLYAPTENIASTDDVESVWRAPAGVVASELWCETDTGGLNVNLQRDDGTPADMCASDLLCDSTPPTCAPAMAEATVADGETLDLVIKSVDSGTPTRLTLCMEYDYE